MHGNNKSDEELRAPPRQARSSCSTRSTSRSAPRRRSATRARPRHPGVEAETHEAIRTGHHGSKFGLDPEDALEAVGVRARPASTVDGLHVHVGSQLADARAHLAAVELLADFAARCRDELGWTPATVDVGGGFGVRHVADEPEPPPSRHARRRSSRAVEREWAARGPADARV